MDLLKDKNKEGLIIHDLKKLGQLLQQPNDSFKLALEQKIKEKILAQPKSSLRKIFSLKWVWVTAPATLLLFVMLAEAAEFAGLEIKPYQYIKTTAVPAVSKQMKLAATAVVEEVKKITDESIDKRLTEETTPQEEISPKTSMTTFEPLTEQEKERLVQEIETKLAQEQETPPYLQSTYSTQQPNDFQTYSDFQPQEPQKLAYDTTDYTSKTEPETTSKQTIKDKVATQYSDTKVTTDSSLPSITDSQTTANHLVNKITVEKEPVKEISPADTDTSKTPASPAQPEIITKTTAEPTFELLVEEQPTIKEPQDIYVPPASPPIPATAKTDVTSEKEVSCQNKTEIIVKVKNLGNATNQANQVIINLDIKIIERHSSNKENVATVTCSLEQYNRLILALINLSADFEEKTIFSKADCDEVRTTIYIQKKSLLEKLIPKF